MKNVNCKTANHNGVFLTSINNICWEGRVEESLEKRLKEEKRDIILLSKFLLREIYYHKPNPATYNPNR
jgi:hypothetical protein